MTKADKEGQRKAPILRFKGFTDDWEQRKLNDFGTFHKGKGFSKNDVSSLNGTPVILYGMLYTDFKTHYSVNNISSYINEFNKENTIFSSGNEIIFPSSGETAVDIARSAAVQDSGIIIGGDLIILKINSNTELKFIPLIFLNQKYKRKIASLAQGKSIVHIHANDLKDLEIFIPQKSEQIKISNLIDYIEKLLTLYERKFKLLSQVKKYFLDNLFTEKEYPNLRFKGFTDAWEQRKLENLSEHKSGTSIEKYFSSDGLYKVISIGSYGVNNEYIDQGIRAVKNKTTESKLVRNGQLTMVLNDKTANGNLIGRCLLISKDNEFIVNQRTEIIIPGPDLNENYAYYYLNGPFRNEVKKIAQGGTQIYVNYSSVKRQKINYPIKDEQIKISKLLKIIKNLIILYENKQQHLTEIKNTLLNTMFI